MLGPTYRMFVSISESILAKIEEAGFTIAMSKEMVLTKEQAEDFYAEHKDKDFFDTLVENMTRYFLKDISKYILIANVQGLKFLQRDFCINFLLSTTP